MNAGPILSALGDGWTMSTDPLSGIVRFERGNVWFFVSPFAVGREELPNLKGLAEAANSVPDPGHSQRVAILASQTPDGVTYGARVLE